tara:strand:+ start:415 stop:537 length:123 start_codon:yes stop_codon:yes gene_type:complete
MNIQGGKRLIDFNKVYSERASDIIVKAFEYPEKNPILKDG